MARGKTQAQPKTSSGRIAGLFRVQPGEGIPVLLLGGAILATEAGYWMGGNGVEGLVFGRFGAGILPYLLMIKGVLAFTLITLYSRYLVVLSRMRMLFIITAATCIVLLVGRLVVVTSPPDWFYFLLYPFTFVVPDLFMVQAWGLAGESFDSRQNKRLFPLITAVGAVGVVIGNFLTVPFADWIGSANLMLLWIGLVFLAFILLYTRRRQLDKAKGKRRGMSVAQTERAEQASVFQSLKLGFTVIKYYKIIGLMVIGTTLMQILYWSLYTVFVNDVSIHYTAEYPNPTQVHDRADAITAFFGLIGGFSTLFAFIFGLFVVNRLFARLGVRNLVLAMPLTNLVAFGAAFLFSGFNTVVGARFLHLMMTEAIGTSVNQTIYNLLPPETREAATPFNNQGISKQGGIVLAGAILLLSVVFPPVVVIALALILSLVYLAVALRMRALYRPSLVQLLREGQQSFFGSGQLGQANIEPSTDIEDGTISEDALKAALAGLQDDSEGTRRLSAELLGQMAYPAAISPLIMTLLADSSGEVRRTALNSLVQLNATEAFPNIAEALSDPEGPVRAEAAIALRNLGVRLDYSARTLLEKALNDRDPAVRREAALTLLFTGQKGPALMALWEMGVADDAQARREAAMAYGQINDRVMLRRLVDLLDDFNPEVRREAASSLGRIGGKLAVKALMSNLEDLDPGVLEETAQALANLRQESGPALLQYLQTTRNGEAAACTLRALTLAKIEEKKLARARSLEKQLSLHQLSNAQPAADASAQPNGLLPTGHPLADGIGFDLSAQEQAQLLAYGQGQLNYAARMGGYLGALHALDLVATNSLSAPHRDPADLNVLLKSLQERYDAAVLRAVSVVGLLGDVEALSLVASGLQAKGRRAARMRADAIEALENFGDPDLTPRLVDLLEGREASVLAAKQPGKTMSDILLDIWMEKDPWLQVCVLYVIGAFELRRLRLLVEQAVAIEGENDYLIEETGTEALKRLKAPPKNNNQPVVFLEDAMQTLSTLSTMSRIVLLQKVPIFANLRPEDLRRVALVCKERLFAPGDIICYEGDPGDELYIVVSGQVQVLTGFGSGQNRVLAVSTEGEAVGMMAILDDIPRSATLRAHGGPVRLLILGADEFKRILRERPEMAAEVIRVLSRLLRETNKRIEQSPAFTDNIALPAR